MFQRLFTFNIILFDLLILILPFDLLRVRRQDAFDRNQRIRWRRAEEAPNLIKMYAGYQ